MADPRNTVPVSEQTKILWLNDGGNFNVGFQKMQGIDWTASYDFDLGDYDNAIKDYTEAIRLRPVFADLRRNRGEILAIKHDYKAAIEDFTEAIKINSSQGANYLCRARASAPQAPH